MRLGLAVPSLDDLAEEGDPRVQAGQVDVQQAVRAHSLAACHPLAPDEGERPADHVPAIGCRSEVDGLDLDRGDHRGSFSGFREGLDVESALPVDDQKEDVAEVGGTLGSRSVDNVS